MDFIPEKKLSEKVMMPVLGLGTWQMEGAECAEGVRSAIELGYRHIDTAEKYLNEDQIGKAIKGFPRDELFITSKVSAEHLSYDSVLDACAGSLEKLGTDYLDLYLVHWPNESVPVEETISAFKELEESGKIRSSGVSNFFINHLEETMPAAEKLDLSISVNQVEFHPLLFDRELLSRCRDIGVVLTAYSPLARKKALNNPVIADIASKYSRTPAQITLRWELHKDVVVIPKAASPGHQKENINIFDFELDDEDIKRIDEIGDVERLVSLDLP